MTPWSAVVIGASVNQSERLKGMADHLNAAGSTFQWVLLGLILVGVALVVLLLRWVYQTQQKREKTRKAQAKRNRDAARANVPRSGRQKKDSRRPSSGPGGRR